MEESRSSIPFQACARRYHSDLDLNLDLDLEHQETVLARPKLRRPKVFTLIVAGSRGDLVPYLALGRALRQAGHRVRLASTPEYADRAADEGLEFFAFHANLSAIAARAVALDADDPSRTWHWLPRFLRLIRESRSYFEQVLVDTFEACSGSDAIISSAFGFGVPHVAQKLGVPHFWGFIQPMTPTRSFPFWLAPKAPPWLGPNLMRRWNWLSYRAASRVAWRLLGPSLKRFRRNTLNLPPEARRAFLRRLGRGDEPVLYAFSESLLPRPDDWSARSRMTGQWTLERASKFRPAPELMAFLDAGPPPLYITLGNLERGTSSTLDDLLRRALVHLGHPRVIVQKTSRGSVELLSLPGVHLIDEAPYDWLMPRVDGVVHHGGPGTLGDVLRAGRPSFIVPKMIDQFFWAERALAVGATSRVVSVRQLNLESLIEGLESLRQDGPRQCARNLAQRMKNEGGVNAAVELIEAYLDDSRHLDRSSRETASRETASRETARSFESGD